MDCIHCRTKQALNIEYDPEVNSKRIQLFLLSRVTEHELQKRRAEEIMSRLQGRTERAPPTNETRPRNREATRVPRTREELRVLCVRLLFLLFFFLLSFLPGSSSKSGAASCCQPPGATKMRSCQTAAAPAPSSSPKLTACCSCTLNESVWAVRNASAVESTTSPDTQTALAGRRSGATPWRSAARCRQRCRQRPRWRRLSTAAFGRCALRWRAIASSIRTGWWSARSW